MEPTRLLFRLTIHLDNFLTTLTPVLSFIYILLTSALIISTAFIYLTHLRPLLYTFLSPPLYLSHSLISLYLLFSVTCNYIRCLITSAGSPTSDSEAFSKPFYEDPDTETKTRSETWRWCIHCRAPKPPRTHHCSTCKRCFLRLCHHCPAMGRCIGRDNYPFFLRFVLSAWFGSGFAAFSSIWILKRVRSDDAVFFVAVGGAAVTLAVGVLGAWHCYLVATGQTTIEWLENRGKGFGWSGPFDKGFLANLKEVFGGGGGLLWRMLMPIARGDG